MHEAFERQEALLRVLGPRLPAAVPRPRWMTGPSPSFRHGAIGYPKLPGQLLTEELFYAGDADAFGADLAHFLTSLHAVPAAAVPMLRSTSPEQRMQKERAVRDDVLPVLQQHLTVEEVARAEAWWSAYLTDAALMSYQPCVTHGDFWWGNMLVDGTGSRLLGVLDWELASIADPARDFAGLGYLGLAFLDAVIEKYARNVEKVDDGLRRRSHLVFEVREFYGVRYAAAYPQSREMNDALAKVRRVLASMTDS